MKRITLLAPATPYVGYSQHAFQIIRWFEKFEIHVAFCPLIKGEQFGANVPLDIREHLVGGVQPEPFEILLAPPGNLPTPQKQSIVFSMWESTRLSRKHVELFNQSQVECVVVPCRWCADNFKASGVTKPIVIIPLGIDPMIFYPRDRPKNDRFVFGAAGRMAHGGVRKGLNGVIEAFQEAFRLRTDVELRIKCYPDCNVQQVCDPRITFLKGHTTDDSIAEWLSRLDCFVSGATAEGWGLWQHQAAAMGIPVMSVMYGGVTEFLDSFSTWMVGFTEEPAKGAYAGMGDWAEPDWTDMVEKMRLAVERPFITEPRRISQLTWENSCRHLFNLCKDYGAFPGETAYWNDVQTGFGTIGFTDPPELPSIQEQCKVAGWDYGVFDLYHEPNEVCFNPTIIDWAMDRWLIYRKSIMVKGQVQNSTIRYARLDDKMRVIKDWQVKDWQVELGEASVEDPRAYLEGATGKVHLSYGRLTKEGWCHQEFAALNNEFSPETIWKPDMGRNTSQGHEKNWLWFRSNGQWNCIYELEPMTVAAFDHRGRLQWYTKENQAKALWDYGVVRGGSNPVFADFIKTETFLREGMIFFRSSLPWRARKSRGGVVRRYYVGALTFSTIPPFRITSITKEPILIGCPNDEEAVGWGHCCVLPGGCVVDGNDWLVALGENDERCSWVKIPMSELEERLEPV